MLNINTNLSSLIAQGNLHQSTNKLNQAIERMTTGYKINHASDNAANYSIATKMDTRMGALQVAENNTLQGLEMMYTTSESLSLVGEKLARMRALAVQAQNGTYGTKSLSALSAEADSLLDEINRINQNATYNGIKLFNTGKAEVTNAGKELELNEQGFLQDVVKVDTTGMTPLGSMADDAILAVGEYTISSEAELVQLKEMSDAGLLEKGSTFVLIKNIDMSGVTGWNGIGRVNLFGGEFNGNGYTISNLTGTQGLFACTDRKSDSERWTVIKNVRLENVKITSTNDTRAAICGSGVDTNISNCSVQGSVSGKRYVGGIVGNAYYCYTSNCYVEGTISGNNVTGGVAGYNNYSSTTSSFFKGNIVGEKSVGGIVGEGPVNNSKVVGNIKGVQYVGGISSNYNCDESYFSGNIQADSFVGGIVGNSTISINDIVNCIVEGTVNGNSSVGAIAGNLYSGQSITNSYYYGKLTNNFDLAGNMDTAIINNVVDITIPCDYTFQVGVSGESTKSSVSYTTYIEFGGLKELLVSGIESDESLTKIDELIKVVNMKQTELGAMENRLLSVLDEISVQYDNLVSSYSTIKDADMAEVSSQYIQQQILQQASATLLATANQTPALALQLL